MESNLILTDCPEEGAYMWLQVRSSTNKMDSVPVTEAPYMRPQAVIGTCGYQEFNWLCGCSTGSIVRLHGVMEAIPTYVRKLYDIASIDMWIDDEGLLKECRVNACASLVAGQYIVSSAVIMMSDSDGYSHREGLRPHQPDRESNRCTRGC